MVPAECPDCGSLDTAVYATKGMAGWVECKGRLYKQVLQHRKCRDCQCGFKITAIQKNRSRTKV
jgi:hypothetical protein